MKTFVMSMPFKVHQAENYPILSALGRVTEVHASKEDLLAYYKKMCEIRQVEVTCEAEYNAHKIHGFCHLYDGQEAIAVGTGAALTREDDWITTYRCHGAALVRDVPVAQLFAENFGAKFGCSHGKGGSMHLFNKESHFYGGAAIVGAHVPVATGLAFYHKYRMNEGDKQTANVSLVMYGDGAANQGQAWEAANMAMLWKLPVIFVIENNQYGLGTSSKRSSALTEYYKQGGEIIPGIQLNGMDVLAVREGIKAAKEHVRSGFGPVFVEAKTYRYHGHSMADSGVSYRTQEEIKWTRLQKDPIALTRHRLIEMDSTTLDELNEVESTAKMNVQSALVQALACAPPPLRDLYTDVYTTGMASTVENGRFRMESENNGGLRMPNGKKAEELL